MLIFGRDALIAEWVSNRIPFVRGRGFGTNIKAIGVADKDGNALAGVVFHDFNPDFLTISFSIAAETPRWATRRTIAALLMYPFEDAGVQKLWTITPHKNERALRLIEFVGFKRESVMARQFGRNEHAIISRMFVEDYNRLYKDKVDGLKAVRANAA